MPLTHGTPDWGVTAGQTTVFELGDLAELAVRLGSIDSFHRAGTVIFLSGFSGGLAGWVTNTLGAGSTVDLTAAQTRSPLLAARLAGGAAAGSFALLERRLAYPVLSGLGFEVAFFLLNDADRVNVSISVYNGTTLDAYGVRYDDVNNRLQYLDSAAVWTTFATGVDLMHINGPFHVAKLIVDAAAGEYASFILNETVYSLAGIAVYAEADATEPHLRPAVTLWPLAGAGSTMYVDDWIVTQNEPV